MNRDEQLTITYNKGLEILREHVQEIIRRVMQGRNEGKGNFAYLKDQNIVRERKLGQQLQLALWQIHLIITRKEDKKGYCGVLCFECPYKRYNFHSPENPNHWNNEQQEGWYCQAECECK